MSTEAFKDFAQAVKGDSETTDALARALKGGNAAAASEILSAFVRERGYDVTVEDVRASLSRVRQARGREGDLADDELDGVAGGISLGPTGSQEGSATEVMLNDPQFRDLF